MWSDGVRFSRLGALFQDWRFWLAALAALALLVGLILWGVRGYHRAQARSDLNRFAPFQNPAMDLIFPRLVRDSPESRAVLEAGVRQRLWTLHPRGGTAAELEIRLTNEGQRWFSIVGNQVIATFKAGARQATRVVELEDIFPTRRIRFRFRWTQLHPAVAVLGKQAPETGAEYEGEALFRHESGGWRLMHWSTPAFDDALRQFQELAPTP